VNSYRGDLIAQALSRGLTREEAEDVASECILRAALKDDLDLEHPGGWLRRVAFHLAMDTHRARTGTRHVHRLAGTVDLVHDPSAEVDDKDEAAWVGRLVCELPERQQAVLRHRAAGLTVGETAQAMGTSYKTVESLTSRARSSVRRALAGTLSGAGLLWGWCRRAGRLPAEVPGAVALAGLTLGAWTAPALAPDARPAVVSAAVPTRHVEAAPPAAVALVPGQEGVPARKTLVHRPAAVRYVALLGSGSVGPVAHGDARLSRTRNDEPLLRSLETCLAAGPVVGADRLGCAQP
jgi:RNA polymerase sigma factor (sigma-70 family)